MANKNEKIKMPINEPAKGLRKSQIQEFIDYYNSPGIQHIAMSTKDIIETVTKLRDKGVQFLNTPNSYYENLSERVGDIDENLDVIKDLGILIDKDENGYMLQIFTNLYKIGQPFFMKLFKEKAQIVLVKETLNLFLNLLKMNR